MANSISHAALPYPIKNARFTVQVPYLDADGDPTDPTTPDTEVSIDGAAFADCAEEVSTITGSNGVGYLTLTGAETNASAVALAGKVASGPKATLMLLNPRVLASVGTGTLSAGSAGGGTLGTLLGYDVTGCFIKTTGGTGGGGTGGASNQARKIITYNTSTGAFTVAPNWETTPDNTTTYEVLLPEGVTLGMLKALNPTTAGRTLVVDAAGLADANAVKLGPSGSGTAQTARDIGASVLVGDKTGFSLSSAGVQAIWDATTSALTTIGSIGASLVTVASNVATLISRLTASRAGYLDNLNIGGNVASSAEVTAIQNNTRVVRVVPSVIERPDAAPDTYRVELLLYDDNGNMEAPDSAPTIALVNQGGTDRSSRLDSTTMALIETGRYRAIYTADPGDALEQLVWTFSVVEGGATRKYGNQSVVVDTTAVDFTSADRTKLEALETRLTATRAGYLDNLSAGAVATASALSTAAGNVATILGKFTGITALAQWLGAMAGKQTPDSTALAEMRATGAGSGTFDPATDSPEALAELIAALENLSAAEANAEVVDAIATDARGEPGQGAPPASASLALKIDYLYKAWRNKKTQTASEHRLFADNESTVDQKAAVSSDGTTTTVGEMATGA